MLYIPETFPQLYFIKCQQIRLGLGSQNQIIMYIITKNNHIAAYQMRINKTVNAGLSVVAARGARSQEGYSILT